MTTICTKCFCEKALSGFYKTSLGKPRADCKGCVKLDAEKWAKKNPEARKKIGQDWRKNNLENARSYARKYYSPYFKKKREKDPAFVAKERAYARIRSALSSGKKHARTEELLGCSVVEFQKHLESQFANRPGMSWETRCFWEIDHIKPCVKFDLREPEQQKQCFHYTNQRPIWKIENRVKGGKYGR